MTTVRVRDVCDMMDAWAPPAWAESWDRVGLQIGRPDQPVSGVGVCLSVTEETARRAQGQEINLIVAHHPVIWTPFRALRMDEPQARLCVELAADGMAVFAAHTNLDVAPGGVNEQLALRIGLEKTEPLFPAAGALQVKLVTFVPESHLEAVRGAVCDAGAGVIGDYTHCSFSAPGTGTFLPGDNASPWSGAHGRVNEEPERRFEVLVPKARLGRAVAALLSVHPYEEPAYDVFPLDNTIPGVGLGRVGSLPAPEEARVFAERVRRALVAPGARAVLPDPEAPVRRVAVLGGSGGGETGRIPADVDAYVTGDVRYHDALTARERLLTVVDAGHHATETPVLPEIARRIANAFPALSVAVLPEPDPFADEAEAAAQV